MSRAIVQHSIRPLLLTYVLLITGFICAGTISAQTIDSENSIIRFSVSNMGFRTVKGSFKGLSGTLKFQPDHLSSAKFEVCIKAAAIDTDNQKRDNHLRSADFFEVEKYPSICFVSKEVRVGNTGFVTRGSLTLHGITKEVEIPFSFKNNRLTGTLTLNRLDYNIGEDTGTFMVGNEVNIEIACYLKP